MRCIFLSEQFQYRVKHRMFKLETPGEPGTHLIKIEITDVKDLRTCKNQKTYWKKVNKKVVFLLDTKKIHNVM